MPLTFSLVRECRSTSTKSPHRRSKGGKCSRVGSTSPTTSGSIFQLRHRATEHGAVWLTLGFLKGKPPENMTLHGAHDFNSGGEVGSVSAASPAFATHIGKQFKRFVNALTVS